MVIQELMRFMTQQRIVGMKTSMPTAKRLVAG